MDIKVSTKRARACSTCGLTPEQMAFADLIAVGWGMEDAWAVAIRKGSIWEKAELRREQEKLYDNPKVQARIANTAQILKASQISKIEKSTERQMRADRNALLQQATSKEDMLIDLQQSLLGMDAGTKEWLDVKKLIVEVSRMKQDEIKDEDTTVHYYLPVNYPSSCKNCLLNPENNS